MLGVIILDSMITDCSQAIAKAFKSLREKNFSDDWNIDACVAIYKFHHPEASRDIAIENVVSVLKSNSTNSQTHTKLNNNLGL